MNGPVSASDNATVVVPGRYGVERVEKGGETRGKAGSERTVVVADAVVEIEFGVFHAAFVVWHAGHEVGAHEGDPGGVLAEHCHIQGDWGWAGFVNATAAEVWSESQGCWYASWG